MFKWIRNKIIGHYITKWSRSFSGASVDRARKVVNALHSLLDIASQQLEDGEWTASEQVEFASSLAEEAMNALEVNNG